MIDELLELMLALGVTDPNRKNQHRGGALVEEMLRTLTQASRSDTSVSEDLMGTTRTTLINLYAPVLMIESYAEVGYDLKRHREKQNSGDLIELLRSVEKAKAEAERLIDEAYTRALERINRRVGDPCHVFPLAAALTFEVCSDIVERLGDLALSEAARMMTSQLIEG